MKNEIVFMFSGQGSQYYHMGKELYEKHPRFKMWMDHCDEIVTPLIGTSLIDVLYQEGVNKGMPFDQILYTNPALISIEYSIARILMEMGIQPNYVLGYSLGEISAAIISGVISLEDGLQFIVDSAQLLINESPAASMLAIINSPDIQSEFPHIFENCWLTGNNFENNFVVGGLIKDIEHLQIWLNNKNIAYQKLPVNYGFHTKLLNPLEQKWRQLIEEMDFFSMRIPIISSSYSKILQDVDEEYFWQITRFSVDFKKTIDLLIKDNSFVFIDAGPSGSLATFIKYLIPNNSKSFSMEVMNQFGNDLRTLEKLRDELDC